VARVIRAAAEILATLINTDRPLTKMWQVHTTGDDISDSKQI